MPEFRNYLDFKEGNIPLILSVPHGGILECDSIPLRTTGILGIDKGTTELSKNLIEQISRTFENEKLGIKIPFYIISMVRRSKIDLNRNEGDAHDQNSFLAREIYRFYHEKISEWIHSNICKFGRSLLLDIHGFEKDNRPNGFRDVEVILGTNNLGSLFNNPVPKRDWEKNLRGKIIQKMLNLGINIAPGHPRRKEYVLTGGHITTLYGASRIPKSQAIQIELSDRIRLFDSDLKVLVIKTLAKVLSEDLKSI
ncbi:MAG: hypothetical protein ACFE9N_13285 [Promethearchaeota archaeon]